MSIKTELHELVDRLDGERAEEALAYLRRLGSQNGDGQAVAAVPIAGRMGPPMISGRDFMAQQPRTWQEIAAEQGKGPVENFDDLFGNFWPEEESIDDFIATVREWRREGGLA